MASRNVVTCGLRACYDNVDGNSIDKIRSTGRNATGA
jgi:hypothetical protein